MKSLLPLVILIPLCLLCILEPPASIFMANIYSWLATAAVT